MKMLTQRDWVLALLFLLLGILCSIIVMVLS